MVVCSNALKRKPYECHLYQIEQSPNESFTIEESDSDRRMKDELFQHMTGRKAPNKNHLKSEIKFIDLELAILRNEPIPPGIKDTTVFVKRTLFFNVPSVVMNADGKTEATSGDRRNMLLICGVKDFDLTCDPLIFPSNASAKIED